MSIKGRKRVVLPCGSFTCNQLDKCEQCANAVITYPKVEKSEVIKND